MSIEVFNFQTIAIWAVVDTVVDLIIFKIARIRGITTAVSFFVTFIIPYFSFMFFIQSGASFDRKTLFAVEYFVSSFMNLFNFLISSVIGFFLPLFYILFLVNDRQKNPKKQLTPYLLQVLRTYRL
jgi:hypothetical protein